MPLVSIIMNCYNGSSYLGKAIDSVYAQKFLDWEIIFWDNASTDESGTIAKSYDERLKYFRTEKNTPLGEARNSALSKVSGKYIGFLIATFILMSIISILFEASIKKALLSAFLMSICAYILFDKILDIALPLGAIFR